MRILRQCIIFILFCGLIIASCAKKTPEEKFQQFTQQFFAKYVSEFPNSKLMQKNDIPEHQQQFFDEANGKLQLLADLNNNQIPEYIICGISPTMLQNKEKGPYFFSIFEQTESGIQRLFLQKLLIPPVTLELSERKEGGERVVISFAFYSDFSAEIYFEEGEYHLNMVN